MVFGVRSRVTTVIDQGGSSCMTLQEFRHFIVEKAETQVYAFLSAYLVGGLEGHFYPNLYSPSGVDIDATVASAKANKSLTIELDRPLVMSEQAEKFLAQWEFEHIADSDPVARSHREEEARRLALRCREDAGKAGISSQDLEAAAEGNLIGNMLQALDDAEFRQMYRDQLADQEISACSRNSSGSFAIFADRVFRISRTYVTRSNP
jgi:hypothetical protein